MIVYKLYHIRTRQDGEGDEKLIGIYTTREKAEAAIQRVVGMPGFRDFPNDFEISKHTLDEDGWREGFISSGET